MKNRRTALPVRKRDSAGAPLRIFVVGGVDYEIVLYPHLSSVQPFADSHVNLCNPNAYLVVLSRGLCPAGSV